MDQYRHYRTRHKANIVQRRDSQPAREVKISGARTDADPVDNQADSGPYNLGVDPKPLCNLTHQHDKHCVRLADLPSLDGGEHEDTSAVYRATGC